MYPILLPIIQISLHIRNWFPSSTFWSEKNGIIEYLKTILLSSRDLKLGFIFRQDKTSP